MFVFILRVKEYSETWLFVYPSLHYPPPPPLPPLTTCRHLYTNNNGQFHMSEPKAQINVL